MEEWLRGRPAWQSKHWNYLITHARYKNGRGGLIGEIETTYQELIEKIGLPVSRNTLRNHYHHLKNLGAIATRQKGCKIVISLLDYIDDGHPNRDFSQNLWHPETPPNPKKKKEKLGRVPIKTGTRTGTRAGTLETDQPLNIDTYDTPKKEERRSNKNPPLPPLKSGGRKNKNSRERDNPKIGTHEHFWGKKA